MNAVHLQTQNAPDLTPIVRSLHAAQGGGAIDKQTVIRGHLPSFVRSFVRSFVVGKAKGKGERETGHFSMHCQIPIFRLKFALPRLIEVVPRMESLVCIFCERELASERARAAVFLQTTVICGYSDTFPTG